MVSASAKQNVLKVSRIKPERCSSVILRRALGNQPGEIGHVLAPHARREVISLRAVDRAVVLQQRRRRNAIQRGQSPFTTPVEIHDRQRPRQTGIDLGNRAVLPRFQDIRPADRMRHQHKGIGRHYLRDRAPLDLVEGEADGNSAVI